MSGLEKESKNRWAWAGPQLCFQRQVLSSSTKNIKPRETRQNDFSGTVSVWNYSHKAPSCWLCDPTTATWLMSMTVKQREEWIKWVIIIQAGEGLVLFPWNQPLGFGLVTFATFGFMDTILSWCQCYAWAKLWRKILLQEGGGVVRERERESKQN